MKESPPIGHVSSLPEPTLEFADPLPETNFGPWMLVSCWHGRARGRGASSCASHVNPDVVADLRDGSNRSHSIPVHSSSGIFRESGRGGFRDSCNFRPSTTFHDVTP